MIHSLSQLERKLKDANIEIIENGNWYLSTEIGRFSIVGGQLIRDKTIMSKDELKSLYKLIGSTDG